MSDFLPFLPWQLESARKWLGQRERFAHAWLIHGLPGIGKRQFAMASAASLLCESPAHGLACGQCAACQWLLAGNHPDLRRIRPEALALEEGAAASPDADGETAAASKKAPSRDIRVEQLRSLGGWFNMATHRGGWRVAVIYPAAAMNAISANALLKVLEEPPAHTIFLLVADAPDRLLPTLVSRCRRLPLPVPQHKTSLQWLADEGVERAEAWLAAAGGAPVLARQLAQFGSEPCPSWLVDFLSSLASGRSIDVGPIADVLEKQRPDIWIDCLQRLLVDVSFAAAGAPLRYFPELAPDVGKLGLEVSPAQLAEGARWLAQQRAVAGHPLNAKLLAHSVLQRIALSCGPRR